MSDGHVLDGLTAQAVWEATPDALLLVDPGGTILWTNDEAARLFAVERDELLGVGVERLVPDSARGNHAELRTEYQHQPRRRPMGAGQRLSARRLDGLEVPVHISLSPLALPSGRCTVVAVRDLTDVVLSEDRLVEATKRRLVAEDRDRIARELHDTVIQELFALGMNLQSVVIDDPEVGDRIEATVDTLDEIIRELRGLVFDVKNRTGDTSLRQSILDVAAQLTPSLGFTPSVSFLGPLEHEIPPSVAAQVVPTVREALTNVARHADATHARVELRLTDHLELSIVDNGVGIPAPPTRRSGLANLEARAVLLGGACTVAAADGGGTSLTWRVPVSAEPTD